MIDKGTRPTPQPSSEYVKAVEAIEKVRSRIKIVHLQNCGTQNLLMPCDCGVSDAFKALATLKSHPTPAKEKP